jgi:hypothetical protein
MSPMTGTRSDPSEYESWMSPPSTATLRSSTMIDDSSARFDSTSPVVVVKDSIRDTSW